MPPRAAGFDLLVLRELMGHASPETTAKYVHLAPEARALGRFEATRPNGLWVGDALHGPIVMSRMPGDATMGDMGREPAVEEQVAADLVGLHLGGRPVPRDDGTLAGVHDFDIERPEGVVALEVTRATEGPYRAAISAGKGEPRWRFAQPDLLAKKLAEAVDANVDKLRRATAAERHPFVWVDTVEPGIYGALDGECELLECVLPAGIEALWAVQMWGDRHGCEARRTWFYRPGQGWADVTTA